MSFTKVAPAGIGTEPGTSIRLGDSLLHSTGLDIGTGTGIGVTIRQHGDATFTGIITATKFVGDMEPGGGTGTFDSLTVTGNLGVGGTVTYEDVSNVDSVGIITARGGIRIGAGTTVGPISGIVTYFGDGSQLTGIEGGVTSDAQENTIGGTNAGDSFNGTNATKNTLFGFDAGTAITDGDKNVFFGHKAGEKTTTGFWNVFVGEQAGRDNLGAYGNIAIGRMSLLQNTGSNYSVAVGNGSLVNCSGQGNIGIGFDAGQNVFGTQNNVVIGSQAGDSGTIGGNCIIIGANSDISVSGVSNEITLGDTNITHLRVPGIGVSFRSHGAYIAGVVTATSFVGDGSNLTGLSGVSLANGADNRVVTASSASALNGESGLTYTGSRLTQSSGDTIIDQTNNGYGGLRIVDSSAGQYSVSYILGRNSGLSAHVFKYNGRTQNQSPWNNNGTGNEMGRWSAAGLSFNGDTAAANCLDDYEEGTWTPGASGFTIASTQSATYTKIGRLVFVQCYLNTASGSSGSTLIITGLPFTVKSGNVYQYLTGRLGGASYNNSQHMITFECTTGNTHVIPKVSDGNINWGMLSGTHVMFSGCYQI